MRILIIAVNTIVLSTTTITLADPISRDKLSPAATVIDFEGIFPDQTSDTCLYLDPDTYSPLGVRNSCLTDSSGMACLFAFSNFGTTSDPTAVHACHETDAPGTVLIEFLDSVTRVGLHIDDFVKCGEFLGFETYDQDRNLIDIIILDCNNASGGSGAFAGSQFQGGISYAKVTMDGGTTFDDLTFERNTPSEMRIPGDSNDDGSFDVSDAITLLGHLFVESPSTLPCGDGTRTDSANLELLDANGDGRIDISDMIWNLSNLFLGGSSPVQGEGCIPISRCLSDKCNS